MQLPKNSLNKLGLQSINSGACGKTWISKPSGEILESYSPVDGKLIAKIKMASENDYEKIVRDAQKINPEWAMFPAPKRGEIVRLIGEELRKYKKELGELVSYEMGKIIAEGEGEVQEMIDIADFAVGLSRQLYGLTMHSERALHRMYEQWHPLGTIGIITAFNFPVAVWAWNAMIALVCGDTVIWKPSSKTPLCAIAVQNIVNNVMEKNGFSGVLNLVIGNGFSVGEKLINDQRLPLISATGSCRMGRRIGEVVAKRLGRSLLELGGNNAIVVMDDADLSMTLRATLFGAVGTAGQRCTSTRRLIMHKKIARELTKLLQNAYKQISIGDPLNSKILMGPLIDKNAVKDMQQALTTIKEQGGKIIFGGKVLSGKEYTSGCYVTPCLVEAPKNLPIMKEETFAPILYLITVDDFEEALEVHNNVPQGLSSSIFTNNIHYSERFLSHTGSDCGIANVNIGTSGAEIGGAFGGEKDTGGGREAGSDSWKIYMRRQTNTINWGNELPLAQGIKFEV